MAGDREGAARKAREGVGVSSGDSSAATPKPALGPDGLPLPDADVTLPGVAPSPSPPGRPASPPQTSPLPKGSSGDAATMSGTGASGSSGPTSHAIFSSIGATVFHEGDILGGRYEILKLLGMGGMGAVYKARDMEIERIVGLKVIRPDLADNPAILARFKQELVLARQITHKNIIRIYDLNEADGVKFITMEFIEGEDLRTILTREGKLSPEVAAEMMLQVFSGLQAAHAEGVIHRDLKPSNIMRDHSGRVVIMDFGLARSLQGDGMTQTGMMVGTMEYMSPEQAMGKELDSRSDQYAVGLIFYELLTGFVPFHAESAIASLVKRTQEQAVPLLDVDAAIPAVLSDIVDKCLQREPAARFASTQELVDHLEIWLGKKPGQVLISPAHKSTKAFPRKWAVVGVAALVLAVGGVLAVRNLSRSGIGLGGLTAQQGPVTSVAVIPFRNASGDASLDWLSSSLSENLSTDIGQSAHVHLVSPGRLQQVLEYLRIVPQSQIDQSQLNRIRDLTNADTVIYGQYARLGDKISVNSTVSDLKNEHQYQVATVVSEKDLLAGMQNLASDVRQKLASSPAMLKELQSQAPFVLTTSVPALRAYDEGLRLSRSQKNQDAAKKFEEATEADPNFAMAYSQLAQSYHALGFDDKAEQMSRRAVTLSDNLPARQRYLIEARHAGIIHDTDKALAAYENLIKVNPDDIDTQFALATLYEDKNDLASAKKYLDQVLAEDPKYVEALEHRARVEINAGNPQAALDFLNRGLSQANILDNQGEKAAIYHAMGVAYDELAKPDDAMQNYQLALEIRKKIDDKRGIAVTLGAIADLQQLAGKPDAALASYKEAIAAAESIGAKKELARNLMNLGTLYHDQGKYDEALKSANAALQIWSDIGDDRNKALCLNNIGSVHAYKGEYQDALTFFDQSYQIREKLKLTDDMTESLHNLAETNLKLGRYDTALLQYLKALENAKASGDQSVIARESGSLGALYATQGKYDSAITSLQDALKDYEQAKDRTWSMAETQARYGDALSQVGRSGEGQKQLEEALKLALELKSDSVASEALNWLGDSYFYQGDHASARQQYQKAGAIAAKAKLREQEDASTFGIARLDVEQGHSAAAIPVLQKLVQDSDTIGLKALSVQASNYLAQALLATNKLDAAQRELDSALSRAEKFGLEVELARAHYLTGLALDKAGKSNQSTAQYREVVRILESISKEPGAASILDRADLKDIYREASKSYQGAA